VAQGRRPRFSPDGTKIAYWTGRIAGASPTRPGWGKAFVIDISGGSPIELQPDFAAAIHPIWAPDSKHVLFAGSKTTRADESASWWVTPLDGGPAVNTGFAASLPGCRVQLLLRSPVAWYRNRIIYYQSVDETTDVREVDIPSASWKVTGEPRKLTFGTTRDDFPAVSADGRLVFCSLNSNLDVFSLPMDANTASVRGELARVTNNKAYDSVRDISRDGTRLVFLSRRTGRLEVFGKDLATGDERQLTKNKVDKRQPVISPDGGYVAYAEDGTGANSIFLVPFAGGPQKPVCEKCGTQASWAPDGKHLLITNYASLRSPILSLDVESGQTQRVLAHSQYSLFPRSVSPDGKWISFGVDRGKQGVVLALAPFRPGDPPPESEWVYLTDGSSNDVYPRWSPDCNTIYFSSDREGLIALFAQRLNPQTKHPAGRPTAIYRFGKPSLRMNPAAMWISVAADRIAFSLEELKGNIWMLQLDK
jgi:Tol biopolymer transport system component